MVVPVIQGELRGKRWIVGSSNHGCWLGSFEYHKQRLFASVASQGDVVFDIGAHVGFYTLLASVLVGENGKVVAFEPLPRNLVYLRKHLQLNGVNNVKVMELAVADIDGTTWFKLGKTNAMGRISASGDLEVQVRSLDTLIAAGEVAIPTLIKMDIEGAEFRALQGARAILTQCHPTVFLATHGRDVHNRCCDYLTSLGYELEPITGKSIKDTDEILAFYRPSNGYNNKAK